MKEIADLLPGYNCGECGLKSCREFAVALVDVDGLSRYPLLQQNRFKG
jgi:Na+-translocating ferredoxin:NAD+ oxidoreductase RNF subunit RnfB